MFLRQKLFLQPIRVISDRLAPVMESSNIPTSGTKTHTHQHTDYQCNEKCKW
jgi:hypothetical protein